MEKATLVLEGGAIRGVFTSGVLDYLMEKDMYFTNVIGVSAGSCNAVDYVSKQIGRTRDCLINTDKKYDYVSLRKFVKEKQLLDMDLIFDKYPNEIYPFDFDTYFQSETECEIVTTNCMTGKAEYMTERRDRERLLKTVRASSSMPLLAPIVMVDELPYLDGGLSDSVPINRAMELGNEKIVVVLTRNEGYRKHAVDDRLMRVYRNSYKKYPYLLRTIRRRPYMYNDTMRKIEELEKEGKIFVLRPQVKAISKLERNQEIQRAFYDHGYTLMQEQFDSLQEYLTK